jgi:hypothetical protein
MESSGDRGEQGERQIVHTDVLRLLENKNRCLQKFLQVSEDLLVCARAGDFSTLSAVERRRDAIIKTLELYDRKIAEAVSLLPPSDRDSSLSKRVEALLDAKNNLIQLILHGDEELMTRIRTEKDRIERAINEGERGNSVLKKYKSTWMPEAGEELDKKL